MWIYHFDGNDDLVANVLMKEVVIDYRLNRSNWQMPKLLLTNAIMTTLTATTRMVITKTMMKIKMVKRWHCGRLKGETSVKTQNPGVTHSSCWIAHTHM